MATPKVRFYNRKILLDNSGHIAFGYQCCCNMTKRLYGYQTYPADAPTPIQIDFETFSCSYAWREDDYLSDALSAYVYDSYTHQEYDMCPGLTHYLWYPQYKQVKASCFPNYNWSLVQFYRGNPDLTMADNNIGDGIIDYSKGMYRYEASLYEGLYTQPFSQWKPPYPRLYGRNFSVAASVPVVYVYSLPYKWKQDDGTFKQSTRDDGAWLVVDGQLIMSLPNYHIWAPAPQIVNPTHSFEQGDYIYQFLLVPKAADQPVSISGLSIDFYPDEFWDYDSADALRVYPTPQTPANWRDIIEFKVTDQT